MHEALLYEKMDKGMVQCVLCSHRCRIKDGEFGLCGVRENNGGRLYTHAYGELIAAHVDPIEKKPLYHFLPGSDSFSVATIGCNFRCGFCQNWEISQQSFKHKDHARGTPVSPEEIVAGARGHGCASISYTYTEPTIFFEYALDTARRAHEQGLANVFVTNGYMTGECLDMLRPYLDAANVDLKSFRDDTYRTVCGARLAPVCDSIALMKKQGIWVEVTTLVVPGQNDSPEELKDIAAFLANVDRDIPWHISRFHPDYKFEGYPATGEDILRTARDIGGAAGLNYVYVGNVYGWGNDTACHHCRKTLVTRRGFDIGDYHLSGDRCAFCGGRIPGRFKEERRN